MVNSEAIKNRMKELNLRQKDAAEGCGKLPGMQTVNGLSEDQ